jgi:hypothetical protein
MHDFSVAVVAERQRPTCDWEIPVLTDQSLPRGFSVRVLGCCNDAAAGAAGIGIDGRSITSAGPNCLPNLVFPSCLPNVFLRLRRERV